MKGRLCLERFWGEQVSWNFKQFSWNPYQKLQILWVNSKLYKCFFEILLEHFKFIRAYQMWYFQMSNITNHQKPFKFRQKPLKCLETLQMSSNPFKQQITFQILSNSFWIKIKSLSIFPKNLFHKIIFKNFIYPGHSVPYSLVIFLSQLHVASYHA